MFDLQDKKSNSPVFKAGIVGALIGAVLTGAIFGIETANSDDSLARPYALLAAIFGAFLGVILGAIVGIIVGAIRFARRSDS